MGSLTTNGAGELLQFDATGKLPVDLDIDGHIFTGSGAGLTDLPGGNLTPGTVGLAALDATGTPSATTFLRGDDTWATAVTSVALAVDPVLGTVSGSPVTESGTLAIAAPVMGAGTFIAGPAATSGAAVARTIAASDIYAILSAAMDTAFGSTQGDLLQRSATGWAALAPGTAGQVLQTNGAGANPTWGVGAGGSLVQVPVRQTALSGVANTTGQAAFITTGAGLQPGVTTGAGASPLTLAFANGFGAAGNVDYVEQINADQATYWSALPAHNLSYLAITRTGAGSITPAVTLAPPQYGYVYNQTAQSCLQLNNTNLDDFGNVWTNTGVTFANTSPAVSGTHYGVFNGTSSGIASAAFNTLGSGAWSVRAWVKATSLSSIAPLFWAYNSGLFGIQINITSSGKTDLYISSTGGSWDIANNATGSATLVTGTWYFIELTYDPAAGKYFLYVNGVVDQTISSTVTACSFSNVSLGYIPAGPYYFTGQMQDFEILPYCPHPNGTTYSAPTSAPSISAAGYASDWFDLSSMTMKGVSAASASAGANPTFTVVNRLYLGEANTGASAVSSVVSYAYQGKYASLETIGTPSATTHYNHNVGGASRFLLVSVSLRNVGGTLNGYVFTVSNCDTGVRAAGRGASAYVTSRLTGNFNTGTLFDPDLVITGIPFTDLLVSFNAQRSW